MPRARRWHAHLPHWASRLDVRVLAVALLVALGYYVAANLALVLRIPPLTPSVLWPPNAILTAALLLAPVRRWWVYLAAALPAHLAAEAGWPLPLVLALFVTNSSEAILAAVSVRRWSDEPTRLDTLRRALVFIGGAGILAPFVSSFLDAAVVTASLGEPYWLVWRARFFSNVLTELTVAPAIILAATSGWASIRRASPARKLEAGLLALSLAFVALAILWQAPGDASAVPALPHAPVTLFVPVVLWAAVRFRAGGVSASMLAITLMLTWAVTHGRGPFPPLSPGGSALSLQLHLSVSIVPLMCLAALIAERRRFGRALAERLSFEKQVARLSGAFVHLPSDRMDAAFAAWLERIGTFLEFDHLVLLRAAEGEPSLQVAHAWHSPAVAALPRLHVAAEMPWIAARLLRDEPTILSSGEEVPLEAAGDDTALHRRGIQSMLVLPLRAGGRVFGGLAFVSMGTRRIWSEEVVASMKLLAEVFGSALARKESEDALRANELMQSAILGSLESGVAVLDRHGRIVAVNPSWRSGDATADAIGQPPGVGANYLDAWRTAARRGERRSVDALAGMEAVLSGARPGFTFEGPSRDHGSERWHTISMVALNHADGGAVVSRTDVTERKRAELEAHRSHQALAHVTRVSAMGELTASLAHELNQPLTGILANAQAGQRLLNVTPVELGELREILADIVEDDKRAAEVISRVRDLVRKGSWELEEVDVDALVRDVVRLLGSDTVIRDVTLSLELETAPATVHGDRVQLQQVVLNLILNAMEAMAECEPSERRLIVRTRCERGGSVVVGIVDSGAGLDDGAQEAIFEPFYTTKPAGMGMGLAIARSIVASHGGTIGAANNPVKGATVHFTLPRSHPT